MSIYLIEEVYELVEAVRTGDVRAVCEELGDVLFHILFMANLYHEAGEFDLPAAATQVLEKMIRRHPHVFGDTRADDVDAVRQQWTDIKKQEKKDAGQPSVLDSVPGGLPALMRAYRISERAAGVGFDWDDIDGVMRKVEEEWDEFVEAVARNSRTDISLEFGDILFTLVNVARFARIHPETALAESTHKFEQRFKRMEDRIAAEGQSIDTAPRDRLESLWNEIKKTV